MAEINSRPLKNLRGLEKYDFIKECTKLYNLATIDLSIIVIYMIGMLVIGYIFTGKINDSCDFYLAGRSLNFFVIAATVCASIIGGSALIGRGGVMYDQGIVGIMLAVPYLIGMYVFSFTSGRIQQNRSKV